MPIGPIELIAQSIQLAVAPVFLLTGIAAILGVLTNRLGRVIDRVRRLEAEIMGYDPAARRRAVVELGVLGRRMAAAHWAIVLCTLSALFVCAVVAILFIGEFVSSVVSVALPVLFIVAMALLIAGLVLFLVEVQIAMRSIRVRKEMLEI